MAGPVRPITITYYCDWSNPSKNKKTNSNTSTSQVSDTNPVQDSNIAPRKASLLGIPREMRDTMYEYTFSETVILSPRATAMRNTGLILTCRQLYNETRIPYFTHTIFQARFSTDVQDLAYEAGMFLPLIQEIRLWEFSSYGPAGYMKKRSRGQTIECLWGVRFKAGVLRTCRRGEDGKLVWDMTEREAWGEGFQGTPGMTEDKARLMYD